MRYFSITSIPFLKKYFDIPYGNGVTFYCSFKINEGSGELLYRCIIPHSWTLGTTHTPSRSVCCLSQLMSADICSMSGSVPDVPGCARMLYNPLIIWNNIFIADGNIDVPTMSLHANPLSSFPWFVMDLGQGSMSRPPSWSAWASSLFWFIPTVRFNNQTAIK